MKKQKTQKDKPIKAELEFEEILESFLNVKPPEKQKPVKKQAKQKPPRKAV